MSTFSINLSKKRKEKRLTQKEIAAQLEVKLPTYQAWEEGRSQPSFEMLVKISHALECELQSSLLKI